MNEKIKSKKEVGKGKRYCFSSLLSLLIVTANPIITSEATYYPKKFIIGSMSRSRKY
ncbi:hypothetical protein [Saccharolobus islandicus]|uniref:hypothetical protein n=1 Tax=Saccharolobus islandicus TaxID=43080 RepID=UPI000B302DB7|nr:hypothetical protein [Sulfolobus islandicus]